MCKASKTLVVTIIKYLTLPYQMITEFQDLEGKSRIPLISGCDLFMKYVTKAFQLQQSKV